jgi:hypothetical protein
VGTKLPLTSLGGSFASESDAEMIRRPL